VKTNRTIGRPRSVIPINRIIALTIVNIVLNSFKLSMQTLTKRITFKWSKAPTSRLKYLIYFLNYDRINDIILYYV
jgi:hypothetical protein